MAPDLALDGPVDQQLGQVSLGHQQVEQVGFVGAFGLKVFSLHLVHFLPQLFNLLDGRGLLPPLNGLYLSAPL